MSFASALLLLFLIAFTAALGAANDAYDITVPLKIKDKEYTITFPNTYEGADATARRFCEVSTLLAAQRCTAYWTTQHLCTP